MGTPTGSPPEPKQKLPSEKLVRWLVFGVVFALLPLFFNYLKAYGRGATISPADLSAHGELLLISAAIAAAAVGELLASGRRYQIAKIIAGGGSVLLLAVASLWFADISTLAPATPLVNYARVSNASFVVFGLTVVSSACCVVLSEAH